MTSETFVTTNRTQYGKFIIEAIEEDVDYEHNTSEVTVNLYYYSKGGSPCSVDHFKLIGDNFHLLTDEYKKPFAVVPDADVEPQLLQTFTVTVPHNAEYGTGHLNIEITYMIEEILGIYGYNSFLLRLTTIWKPQGRCLTREKMQYIIENMASEVADYLGDEKPIAWAYYQFPNDELATTPFIVYFFDEDDDFKAENSNYATIENLVIEYYSPSVDFVGEDIIQGILNNNNIVYSKSFSYIESEEMYQTRYESEILILPD